MWECIREFVEKLPVSYRTVVVLSDLEGMKNSETAKILGISQRPSKSGSIAAERC
jgi:RNA polymerase sigma-70 factor (ECF subfamily)